MQLLSCLLRLVSAALSCFPPLLRCVGKLRHKTLQILALREGLQLRRRQSAEGRHGQPAHGELVFFLCCFQRQDRGLTPPLMLSGTLSCQQAQLRTLLQVLQWRRAPGAVRLRQKPAINRNSQGAAERDRGSDVPRRPAQGRKFEEEHGSSWPSHGRRIHDQTSWRRFHIQESQSCGLESGDSRCVMNSPSVSVSTLLHRFTAAADQTSSSGSPGFYGSVQKSRCL